MIERLLVDNFRCFVNFEWKPGRLAPLMGDNGSGKTSIIDVLWGVRALVVHEEEVRSRFPVTSRTQWDTRWQQRVELSARLGEGLYTYELLIEHHPEDATKTRVKKETLRLDALWLMDFDEGELHLFNDQGGSGPTISARWGRSGLGAIAPHRSNKKLMAFKRWLGEDVWCFKPDPRAMSSRTDEPAEALWRNLSNFASWYPTFIAPSLDSKHSRWTRRGPISKRVSRVGEGLPTPSISETSRMDSGR